MLGRTHAATGWCAGLALAPWLDAHTLPQAVVVATVTAGAALIPDLDHPGSRASRIAGPVTGLLSTLAQSVSSGVYRLTRGPRDENHRGKHRHLTHTLLFAVGLAWAVNRWTSSAGWWAVLLVLAVAVLLAVDAFGDWLALVFGGALLLWLPSGRTLDELAGVSGWLGIAVGAGCFVHCLGDALTLSGCPFLWPLPIAGETWYELRPPYPLRFRTGGRVELWLVWPVCAVTGVLLLPGVWPAVAGLAAG